MLNSPIMCSAIHSHHRRENMQRIRSIYIDSHLKRRNTLMNGLGGLSKESYYEKMIKFILDYCDKKIETLPEKSTLKNFYHTQFPTSFMLLDYIMEWEEPVTIIRENFYDMTGNVTTSIEARKFAGNIYPGPLKVREFTDLLDEHVKSKIVIEMFLLRCKFDLEYAIELEYRIPHYGAGNGWRFFNAYKYMKHFINRDFITKVKGDMIPLAEEVAVIWRSYADKCDYYRAEDPENLSLIGNYFRA